MAVILAKPESPYFAVAFAVASRYPKPSGLGLMGTVEEPGL
jgi:hypothetical protein